MLSSNQRDSISNLRQASLRRAAALVLGTLVCLASPALADDEASQKIRLFGYVEPIVLVEGNIQIEGRLDTGAETTSLHAANIEYFEKEDDDWVRFETEGDDGKNAQYEREVVRRVQIVGEENERPVIMMEVCLGNLQKTVEVNLNDRTDLTYSALIGRNYMQPGIIVNGSETNTSKPDCDLAVPE